MRAKANIEQVALLQPDYVGFIFYPQSKRYVGDAFEIPLLTGVKKTGVFVNANLDEIKLQIEKHNLNAVQLHGHEPAAFCVAIRNLKVEVIKAFGVGPGFDWGFLSSYQEAVDYFLFDTQTPQWGGSGISFDWNMLQGYTLSVPFFLSGGLQEKNLSEALCLHHPALVGFDFNSGVEVAPGMKDIKAVETMIRLTREIL